MKSNKYFLSQVTESFQQSSLNHNSSIIRISFDKLYDVV